MMVMNVVAGAMVTRPEGDTASNWAEKLSSSSARPSSTKGTSTVMKCVEVLKTNIFAVSV